MRQIRKWKYSDIKHISLALKLRAQAAGMKLTRTSPIVMRSSGIEAKASGTPVNSNATAIIRRTGERKVGGVEVESTAADHKKRQTSPAGTSRAKSRVVNFGDGVMV